MSSSELDASKRTDPGRAIKIGRLKCEPTMMGHLDGLDDEVDQLLQRLTTL